MCISLLKFSCIKAQESERCIFIYSNNSLVLQIWVSLLLNSKKWLVRQKGKMKLDKQVKLVKQGFPPPSPTADTEEKRLWLELFYDSLRWWGQSMQPSKGMQQTELLSESGTTRVTTREECPLTGEKEMKSCSEMKRQEGGSSQELSFCSSTNASGPSKPPAKRG